MPVSAVQIVVGSHQHCRERDSGSPWRGGGDLLLCKESHFYLYFLSGMLSSVLDDEKMFSIYQILQDTPSSILLECSHSMNFLQCFKPVTKMAS